MLFSRIALPLLGLVGSVLALSSESGHDAALEKRHNKPSTPKCGCEASVQSAIKTATKQIKHAGASIKTACATNKHKSHGVIVAAVKPHLIEIQTSLKLVSGAVRIHKSDLINAQLDVHGLAVLVAGLLNACVTALLPLHLLIKTSLGLRLLLTPLLKLLSVELLFICKTLFAVADGLLEIVLTLVNGSLFVVLHSLGNVFAGLFGILGFSLGLGCF
ncbi:uncharacterized protein JCM6883_004650 [Sporobolomyces salmoneus]|uniref:uncharacterized protein n=1 Tax=Sporobolomyces salmoneus TaxID=183962 RepID=UPI003176350C